MIIEDIKAFAGQHCETTTTGTLLLQNDISMSEPMLFGLGEGLNFIFWNMKGMEFPFLGGRIKPDQLTRNICNNLNLKLEIKETASTGKAWQNVTEKIEKGMIVGLKLDSFYLEYFTKKIHFAAHYVAFCGYDDTYAYLVDTRQQGGLVKTSLKSLELARNEKGPMSSRNLSYTISKNSTTCNLPGVIVKALKSNAKEFLNPAIANMSYKGIQKTASEIKRWFRTSPDKKRDFITVAHLMEKAGTGGSLFRNLYRDFLEEALNYVKKPKITEAFSLFKVIAPQWKEVVDCFEKAGNSGDEKYILKASEHLLQISDNEKRAMEKLVRI